MLLSRRSRCHPSSNVLPGCPACTDLGVGIIWHPPRSGIHLSGPTTRRTATTSGSFYHHELVVQQGNFINNDCNECRHTSCSVPGPEIQTGSDCEAGKDPRCYSLILQHLCSSNDILHPPCCCKHRLCSIVILHNNLGFLLHQDLRQTDSSLSSTKTRPRSPMSTKWRRNLTE